jgi:spermidine/putrescine-binding protein
LLVWEGYTPEKYVKEFEKEVEVKHGRKVKMEVTYAESPDDFFDSIRDNSVDLVTISHHTIKDERFHFIDKGLILPFDLKNIPNHVNVIPDLKQADFHFSNGKIYGVPVANGPYGLAYNTKIFKQAPQSWKVLWNSAYKNKYVIGAHEYIYNANITAMVLGYPRESISNFDVLNNKEFRAKLRQLAVNAHSLWVGVDKPEDLFGMSLAASWGDSLSALKRRGKIWKMADPVEGTIWWIDEYAMTGVLADKPFLKKVAEEWINKSLSSNFQIDHLIREVGIYPVINNITDKLTDQENKRVHTGTPGSFMDKHILQATYSQRDRNGLQILWEEAMQGISIKK